MITLTAEQAQQIEEALEDIVRVFKFETGTPVEALAVIRAARAQGQAEQEPVAKFLEDNLVVENERVDKSGHRVLEIREEELLRIMEIYAAPVQQVDLTDYEIVRLYAESPMCNSEMIAFARAAIAAFKGKNK